MDMELSLLPIEKEVLRTTLVPKERERKRRTEKMAQTKGTKSILFTKHY
jgi:hypothetical protein